MNEFELFNQENFRTSQPMSRETPWSIQMSIQPWNRRMTADVSYHVAIPKAIKYSWNIENSLSHCATNARNVFTARPGSSSHFSAIKDTSPMRDCTTSARARVNLIKLVACRATFHWDSSAAIFFILIFDRQRKKFATKQCDQPKLFREEIISISKRNLVEVCRARHLSREHDSFDLLFAFIIYDSEFYAAERASTSAVLLTWVVSACPLNELK